MTKCQDYFYYLEQLKQKGIRTVKGAILYLQKEYGLSYEQARRTVLAWNNEHTFSE